MSRIFLIMRVISSISVGFSLLFLVYCIYEKFSGYFSSCKEIMTSLVGGLFKIATVILSIGLCCTIFLNASFQQKIGLYNYNLLKEGTYCFNIKYIQPKYTFLMKMMKLKGIILINIGLKLIFF